jgi:hypothetical protein
MVRVEVGIGNGLRANPAIRISSGTVRAGLEIISIGNDVGFR